MPHHELSLSRAALLHQHAEKNQFQQFMFSKEQQMVPSRERGDKTVLMGKRFIVNKGPMPKYYFFVASLSHNVVLIISTKVFAQSPVCRLVACVPLGLAEFFSGQQPCCQLPDGGRRT
jgi:hypothetical protein